MNFQIKVLLYAFMLMSLVYAYPKGAPESVCESLTPGHRVDPQTIASPYEVKANLETSPNPSNVVDVIISSPSGTSFRGFVIQARLATDHSSIVRGQFKATDEHNSRTISCGSVNNTLTHSDRNDKDVITAKWFPPENFNKEVVFVASVVKDKKTFWVNQTSKPIAISYLSTNLNPEPNQHNHKGKEVATAEGEPANKHTSSSSMICLNLLTLFIVILTPFI